MLKYFNYASLDFVYKHRIRDAHKLTSLSKTIFTISCINVWTVAHNSFKETLFLILFYNHVLYVEKIYFKVAININFLFIGFEI